MKNRTKKLFEICAQLIAGACNRERPIIPFPKPVWRGSQRLSSWKHFSSAQVRAQDEPRRASRTDRLSLADQPWRSLSKPQRREGMAALASFKTFVLAAWYDPFDVRLAEMLSGAFAGFARMRNAGTRRFCALSSRYN
jgi:hypothetical protein